MSFADLKEKVLNLSYAERRELLKLLLKTRAEYDQEWTLELARRHREMLRGKKVGEAALLRRSGLAK
jgi:hypothetical protein